MCLDPKRAFASLAPNENGAYMPVMNPRNDEADFSHPMPLPCRKCDECLQVYQSMKAVQLFHEGMSHEQFCMLTPTFDEGHLPESVEELKHQFRLFRLRMKRAGFADDRYYASIERGDRGRLHLHVMWYGHDFLQGSIPMQGDQYENPILTKIWKNGFIRISPGGINRCMYVAKYTTKKLGDNAENFGRPIASRYLGARWVGKFADDIRRLGYVVIEGHKFAIPRSYLSWAQDDLQEVRDQQREHARELTPAEDSRRRREAPARKAHMLAKRELTEASKGPRRSAPLKSRL